jgi:hypothetical protein
VAFRIPTIDASGLRIEAADGRVIPTSARQLGNDFLFGPDQPLDAGQVYRFHYDDRRCYFDRPTPAPETEPSPSMIEFETLPAAPPPTGAVGLLAMTRELRPGSDPPSGVVTMTVRPSAALTPYLGLIEWTVSLSGQRIDLLAHSGAQAPNPRWPIANPSFKVGISCAASPPGQGWSPGCDGTSYTAPRGHHRLRIVAHILGQAAELPALEQDVDVSCDGNSPPGPLDAGIPLDGPVYQPTLDAPPDRSGTGGSTPDASRTPDAGSPVVAANGSAGATLAPARSAGGCSIASDAVPSRGAVVTVALLATALLIVRRRHRKARGSDRSIS